MTNIYRGNLEHIRRQLQDAITTVESDLSNLSITDLTDGPPSLTADEYLRVNSGGTAIETVALPTHGAAIKSSNQQLSTATYTAVTDISFAALANTRYLFDAFILCNDPFSGGVSIDFTVPTSATYSYADNDSSSRTDSNFRSLTTNSSSGWHVYGAFFVGDNAGNVQMTASRVTSPGVNPSILFGSWIRWYPG